MKVVENGKHVFLLEYIFHRCWTKSGRVLFAESNLENTQALDFLASVNVNTTVNLWNLRRLSARMKYWRGNLRSLFRRLDADINNAAKGETDDPLGKFILRFRAANASPSRRKANFLGTYLSSEFSGLFSTSRKRSRQHARWSGNILSSAGGRGGPGLGIRERTWSRTQNISFRRGNANKQILRPKFTIDKHDVFPPPFRIRSERLLQG